MIPEFPTFKKIELSDKEAVEKFTSKFQSYSDFNFTSLWVWDINEKRMISQLNGNLVVRFTNYITCEPFFSFIGINEVEQTARRIIDYAKKNKVSPILYFIPEETIKKLPYSDFLIKEDKNNFDYIFSTSQLSDYKGTKHKAKRHGVNRFLTLNPNVVFKSEKSINPILREDIIGLLKKWTIKKKSKKGISDFCFESERRALHKILQIQNENLLIFTCTINDKLIGFEIDEIINSKYALAHFSKVDTFYGDINDFLNMRLSQYLKNIGVEFCNWEQDLGIENLRKSKMSYCPISFSKKYKVSLINK